MIPYLDAPWALVAAPLFAALVAALLVAGARRRARRLRRLGDDPVVERLLPEGTRRGPGRRALLLGGAALFAGIAFAGPRWGTKRTTASGRGLDMVLVLDASLSMRATDVRPDRLGQMKAEARRLLALSPGDRIGLIAFAGRSYVLTPLTVDRGALDLYLDNLDPSVVGEPGSSLARAVDQGVGLLRSTPTRSDRALILMSDGEAFDPPADFAAAARRARAAGIAVVTVGFGTTAGSTIPVRTPQGMTVKRDDHGRVVNTRYRPAILQAVAAAAHGSFIRASSTDKPGRIRQALAALRRAARAAPAGRERQSRFALFLVPALLLLVADTALAERRRRAGTLGTGSAGRGGRVLAAVLLAIAAFPMVARADDAHDGDRLFREKHFRQAVAAYRRAIAAGDRSPRLLYDLGTALLAAHQDSAAAEVLHRAAMSAPDAALRYLAYFNLGLAYLEHGRAGTPAGATPPVSQQARAQAFSHAVDAYRRALQLRPTALDAKWNYELADRERRSGGGGGGGGGNTPPPSTSAGQPQSPATGQAPAGGLGRAEASEILSSAARAERAVQARQQRGVPPPPHVGKDW